MPVVNVPKGRCDRSLARSAWDMCATPESRPEGYGVIRAGVLTDSMIGVSSSSKIIGHEGISTRNTSGISCARSSPAGLRQVRQPSDKNSLTAAMMHWLALTRFVHIAGSVLLAAVFAFRLTVLNPAIDSVRGGKHMVSLERSFDRLALWGWMTVICSGFFWFGLVAVSLAGEASLLEVRPEMLELVLFRTQFGHIWIFRFGCCLVLGALLFRRGPESVKELLAMVILTSLAAAGHAGAHSSIAGLAAVAADIGHFIAAALWPGGLVPLLLFLWAEIRAGDAEDWSLVAHVIRRFSTMSLAAVAFLAVTGILNACFIVGTPEALFVTGYGQLLLLKVTLFLLMVGFGAWNLLVLKPGLVRFVTIPKRHDLPEPVALLLRNVLCETVLAAGVLLVVGFLGVTPPPMQ